MNAGGQLQKQLEILKRSTFNFLTTQLGDHESLKDKINQYEISNENLQENIPSLQSKILELKKECTSISEPRPNLLATTIQKSNEILQNKRNELNESINKKSILENKNEVEKNQFRNMIIRDERELRILKQTPKSIVPSKAKAEIKINKDKITEMKQKIADEDKKLQLLHSVGKRFEQVFKNDKYKYYTLWRQYLFWKDKKDGIKSIKLANESKTADIELKRIIYKYKIGLDALMANPFNGKWWMPDDINFLKEMLKKYFLRAIHPDQCNFHNKLSPIIIQKIRKELKNNTSYTIPGELNDLITLNDITIPNAGLDDSFKHIICTESAKLISDIMEDMPVLNENIIY